MKNEFQIKNWLKRARDDLLFAKDVFSEDKHWDYVCWLAHQSVEKYLKAFIIKSSGTLDKKDKTHNLIYLAKIAGNFYLDLKHFKKELRWLSNVYIPARYPVHPVVRFTKKEARESIEIAEKIIKIIKKKLGGI